MRPTDVQVIGTELALKWEDGTEGFVSLEKLRQACPCAGCKGETDVMGNLHKGPEIVLTPQSFQLVRIQWIGGYALQPFWGDGHNSGLYTFDTLKKLTAPEGAGNTP